MNNIPFWQKVFSEFLNESIKVRIRFSWLAIIICGPLEGFTKTVNNSASAKHFSKVL
jgi:hypothetical protein